MKFDKKVLKAIEGSIDKWIGIAYEGEEDGGGSDCALCQMFFVRYAVDCCGKCPIAEASDHSECNDTPYYMNILSLRNPLMLDYLLHLKEWYKLTAERG